MSFSEEMLLAVESKMNRATDEYTNLPKWAWYMSIDELHALYKERTPEELKEYFLED